MRLEGVLVTMPGIGDHAGDFFPQDESLDGPGVPYGSSRSFKEVGLGHHLL